MSGRPRRINQMQADASRRQLSALFENPRNNNAHGKVGVEGKAENSENTLPQSAIELQGAPK